MPDLGQYAFVVLLAYAGSLVLLVGLVGVSLWQARSARHKLDATEARKNG